MKIIKKIVLVFGVMTTTFLMASLSQAHHSTSAFNSEKVVKIEGTIQQFRWTNPHASIKIKGKIEGVDVGVWTVEMTAPNVLINQGWKRSSLKKGDQVTMFVNPLRKAITLKDGSQGGLYIGVVLSDGSSLGRIDGSGKGSNR